MRSHEVRSRFLDHFARSGHLQLPSGSLVPPDWDKSVLITTAGMQPLKRYFLGLEQPPQARLMTVQKCFRTVDIDEVGRTAHHLTFFEMLGNFSIGDYFKRFAVEQAWELVTSPSGFGFDPDKLWASVYEGDGAEIPADEEAIALWLEMGVPPERIVRLGSDNFWQAGPVGPCGPCSELHYDRGPEFGCGRAECGPDCDCDRFIEFWNLVFMQYNMLDGGSLEPLPHPSIDTGAGLERVTMLAQGVESAYLTDAFGDIIEVVQSWSGARYGRTPEETKALKVLADHGRAMSFLASDGIEPGNEGRGYVLRRVIRRAVQHGRRIGLEDAFLPRLHARVVELLSAAHPELAAEEGRVSALLEAEEERFSRTLETGGKLLDDILAGADDEISAADAFKLHDTYGFPIELTVEIAAEHGKRVDEAGFAELMAEQRDRARAATATGRPEVSALDSDFTSEFVGYERLEVTTQVGALQDQGDGTVLLKLRESPFYPKGGGQVADTGWIESDLARAAVEDVVRVDDDQVIVARLEHGELHRGERVRARVDAEARRPTMANHTATHLLHAALRGRLGEHVTQAGSYVGPDKLRFDFRHSAPLSAEELADVERVVNEHVIANHPLHVFVTSRDHAQELGAMMLFGEKYGDHVRVVEISGVSRELCGGTHVRSTAEIGPFVVTRETSSSQGIRRIEAVTAGAGLAHLRAEAHEAEALRRRVSELEAEVKRAARAAPAGAEGNGNVAGLIDGAGEEAGVRIVAAVVAGADGDQLLQLSDRIRSKLSPAAVVLGGNAGGKAHLVASFDGGAQERGLSAVDVIRAVAPIVDGGGGGRPAMARAGGSNPAQLDEAVRAAEDAIRERLRS
jgi:alanyl-tRNA synthetase